MKTNKILLGVAIALVVYLGVSSFGMFSNNIKGSGNIIKETRTLSSFHEIEAGGVFHIEVTQGSPQSVILESDDNIIPIIESKVKGGVLELTLSEGINKSTKMNVYIVVPNLDEIDISGASSLKTMSTFSSNEMEIECSGASNATMDLKCKRLSLDFSGASEGDFTGRSSTLNIESSGASSIDCMKLNADVVSADVSGASNISFSANKIIKIDASGASSVEYLSNGATLDVETSGAASVKKK